MSMIEYVTPFVIEVFSSDGEFDSTNCATFEISNVGETSLLIANHSELKPGYSEFFPALGHNVAYKGAIPFVFRSEEGKTNKIVIKSSKYDRCS